MHTVEYNREASAPESVRQSTNEIVENSLIFESEGSQVNGKPENSTVKGLASEGENLEHNVSALRIYKRKVRTEFWELNGNIRRVKPANETYDRGDFNKESGDTVVKACVSVLCVRFLNPSFTTGKTFW